jgi:hypothetical protein
MDPGSFSFLLLRLIRYTYRLRFLGEERRVYNEDLERTSAMLSDVISKYSRLPALSTLDNREWIEKEIQSIKLALENAKKARGGVLTANGNVEWLFNYKEIAKMHRESLSRCRDTLIYIGNQLDWPLNERQQRTPEEHFQETRKKMLAEIARQVKKRDILYSGEGEQRSRPRLFRGELHGVFILPSILFYFLCTPHSSIVQSAVASNEQ